MESKKNENPIYCAMNASFTSENMANLDSEKQLVVIENLTNAFEGKGKCHRIYISDDIDDAGYFSIDIEVHQNNGFFALSDSIQVVKEFVSDVELIDLEFVRITPCITE